MKHHAARKGQHEGPCGSAGRYQRQVGNVFRLPEKSSGRATSSERQRFSTATRLSQSPMPCPVLVREWGLTPAQTGMILSMGYLGQLIGAILFGWLAEKVGRLKVLLFTILLFVSMDVARLFAAGAGMMMAFRFVQGIGTGGEVPVASAYINELIGSKGRGRFFLLYEVMFLLGLVGAGLIGLLHGAGLWLESHVSSSVWFLPS